MASEAGMNDLILDECVVCGRRAQSRHHEPPKGMGGTKRQLPRLSLCGVGNEDATTRHGARHHSDLKFEKHNDTHPRRVVLAYTKKLEDEIEAHEERYHLGNPF